MKTIEKFAKKLNLILFCLKVIVRQSRTINIMRYENDVLKRRLASYRQDYYNNKKSVTPITDSTHN